jgi:DNA-binding SARP family transcriptional activator/tetratricopeptide (TPR) repeat protein
VLTPNAPILRQLLGALLSRADGTVLTGELVETVWGGTPPSRARKTLQVYVHRLRQLVAQERIVREPAGYRLVVGPGELDVARFDVLVEQARSARGRLALTRADVLFEQALGLWRGEPYADVDAVGIVAEEVQRLTEQRLLVLEEAAGVGLDLGRHAELVADLQQMVTRCPFREQFHALLMLALHRCGRQPEALEVFRETRASLIANLGVEPGNVLQRLHEAILRADDRLLHVASGSLDDEWQPVPARPTDSPAPTSAAAQQTSTTPRFRPAELPAGIPTFVGRIEELNQLCSLVTQSSGYTVPIAAVAGGAGTGKSALAVHVAHTVADKFPDGVLFANLHGSTPGREPEQPVEVLARFLRGCGWPEGQAPATVEEASARFRSVTADRRLLVVLDDALEAEQVRPLIPAGPGSAVLVTSRRVLATLDAATYLQLNGMSEQDASDLLVAIVDLGQLGNGPHANQAVRNVVRLCGRLPLAIRIAAARLAAHPEWGPSTLARRLRTTRRRLDELRYADLDVRASFAMSTTGLDPSLIRLFALLSLLDLEHITTPTAAAMAGESQQATQVALDALIEAQLLGSAGPERYAFHDLIGLYARELAQIELGGVEQANAIRRGSLYYVATVRNAANVLTPPKEPRLSIGVPPEEVCVAGSAFSTRAEAAAWIDAEASNLLTVARQAASLPVHLSVAVALSAAATGPLNACGHPRILTDLARLAISAAEASRDERGLAQAHNDLAIGYMRTEQLEDALEHAESALRIWSRTNDVICQAGALNNIGIVQRRRGDTESALAHYRRALDMHDRLGNAESQAAILANLSEVFVERGELQQAFAHLDNSLSLYRQEGSAGGEGYALGNIGKVHLQAGDPSRALTCLEQAVQLVSQAELRGFEAEFRWHLGAAHRVLGNPEQGLTCQRQALDFLRRTGTLTADQARAILAHPSPETPRELR